MLVNKFLETLTNKPLTEANQLIKEVCGVVNFFDTEDYTIDLGEQQINKAEFGDWQTNFELAKKSCLLVKDSFQNPEIIIEPTCGKGSFIFAAIEVFGKSLQKIVGVEIYKPYIQQLKHQLLEYGLQNRGKITCEIELIHQSIFEIDWEKCNFDLNKKILVIGNLPWVTNSELSKINSSNLPPKSNFKSTKGIEAITGKSNFDIAESIIYKLFDSFQNTNASLALLIKSSVAKNIIYEQKNGKYRISSMSQYLIDAKKEFDVSVAACLFMVKMGSEKQKQKQCSVYDFYQQTKKVVYGWVGDNFVSNVDAYKTSSHIEGKSQISWWSGVKHDCNKVMELSKIDGKFFNKLQEEVIIEPDLIFPILKSSDLKSPVITNTNRYVIITQRSTSENTQFIKQKFPLTYNYLLNHADYFEKRASIIYKKRPPFSIFGIGDYSFKNYKIAIAGLYKKTTFSLVMPIDDKPVMLDDTCYLMGFDKQNEAECFLKILNSQLVQDFLSSLIFADSKRCINKETLMRIDLLKVAQILFDTKEISEQDYGLAMQTIQKQFSGDLFKNNIEKYNRIQPL